MTSFDKINKIYRQIDPGSDNCLMNDLLWADPLKSKEAATIEETSNEECCISVKFGWPLLKNLLEESGFKGLIRAHQQKDNGYKLHMWNGQD